MRRTSKPNGLLGNIIVAGNDPHADRQSIDFARDSSWQRVPIPACAMLIAESAEIT